MDLMVSQFGGTLLWHTSWAGWLAGVTRGRAHLVSVPKYYPTIFSLVVKPAREDVCKISSSALGTSLGACAEALSKLRSSSS